MSLRVSNNNGYTIGYDDGINYADGRVNTNSINYQSGYNSGISYADSRVNESSISYTSGYNNGYDEGSSNVTIDGESVKDKMELVSQNVDYLMLDDRLYFYIYPTVVINDEIHIVGLSGNKHYKWNGSTWIEVSTLPFTFTGGSSLVVLNNEIHILGGEKHYKWDGSTWIEVSTLPYSFLWGSVVVLNDEIHILGGTSNSTKHYKWDGNTWTEVSTLPNYGLYAVTGSAVVLNDEIHILGGNGTNDDERQHYKWDGTNWINIGSNNLPYKMFYSHAVVLNGEIHLFGGRYGTSYYDHTYHYKWDGSAWTHVGYLMYPQNQGQKVYGVYGGSAVVLNDEIHVFGWNDQTYPGVNMQYTHRIINAKVYRR